MTKVIALGTLKPVFASLRLLVIKKNPIIDRTLHYDHIVEPLSKVKILCFFITKQGATPRNSKALGIMCNRLTKG